MTNKIKVILLAAILTMPTAAFSSGWHVDASIGRGWNNLPEAFLNDEKLHEVLSENPKIKPIMPRVKNVVALLTLYDKTEIEANFGKSYNGFSWDFGLRFSPFIHVDLDRNDKKVDELLGALFKVSRNGNKNDEEIDRKYKELFDRKYKEITDHSMWSFTVKGSMNYEFKQLSNNFQPFVGFSEGIKVIRTKPQELVGILKESSTPSMTMILNELNIGKTEDLAESKYLPYNVLTPRIGLNYHINDNFTVTGSYNFGINTAIFPNSYTTDGGEEVKYQPFTWYSHTFKFGLQYNF